MITYEDENYTIIKTFDMAKDSAVMLKTGKYLIAKKINTAPPPVLLGDVVYMNNEPHVVIDRPTDALKMVNTVGNAFVIPDALYSLKAQSLWRDGYQVWARDIEAGKDVNDKGLAEHDATPLTTNKGS